MVRIALAYQADDKHLLAIQYLEEALSLQPAKSETLQVHNQLGVLHIELGDFAKAREAYHQALTIAEPTGQTKTHAEARYHLGIAYKGLKIYVDAATYFTHALNLYKLLQQNEQNTAMDVANTHYQLGTVCYAQSQYSDANTHFTDALNIYGEDTDTLEVADIFYQLGLVARAQQDFSVAAEKLNVSLIKYQTLEEDVQEEITLVNYHLGLVNFTLDQLDVALENLQQAIESYGDNTDHLEATDIWYHLGMIYSQQNQYDQVIENLSLALPKYLELQDTPAYQIRIGMITNLLGQAYQAKLDYPTAREYYIQALAAYAPTADTVDTATLAAIHHHLGEVYVAENNLQVAAASLITAAAMYQRLGQADKATAVQNLLLQINYREPAPTPNRNVGNRSPQRLTTSNSTVSQTPAPVSAMNTTVSGGSNSTESRRPAVEEEPSSSIWCCCFFGSSARKKSEEVRKYTDKEIKSPLVESLTGSKIGYGSTETDN